ncbi:type IV secretion system DNA-binding domain-containing protein [Candidatus Paracaedibacter acanthamoebae]|uniref:type IV secretion system DNA-binding domain-containing protein n=1 Tax=Candidatus Odyssella acanthamoebae TaxID=91604 RepID=UPI00094B5BA6
MPESEAYFSIRQWVLNPQKSGILFLSCSPEQRSSLRPLLSGWLRATKAALSRGEGAQQRLWLCNDKN